MSTKFFSILKIYIYAIIFFILLIPTLFIPFLDQNQITKNNSNNPIPSISQYISSTNICWPLPGYTRISSPFGYRNIPTAGATSFHGGIDLPAPPGTNIISAISGKVTSTGFMGSGGCSVVVQNDNYTVIFHHISPNYLVKPGDIVSQGQIIAQVGPKNVYGFANNPYKDAVRKSNQWFHHRSTFTLYCKKGFYLY